jgi:hypothetical protein
VYIGYDEITHKIRDGYLKAGMGYYTIPEIVC